MPDSEHTANEDAGSSGLTARNGATGVDPGGDPAGCMVSTLLQRTRDLAVVVDDAGRIRFANESWYEALGYQPEDLPRLHLRHLVPEDDLSRWLAWLSDEDRPQACHSIRVGWRTRGGRVLVLEGALCHCAAEPGEARLLGLFTLDDHTPRLPASLREAEAVLQLLAHHAPVGVFQTDAGGRLVRTNARWRKIAGLRHVEAPHGVWWQMVHPEDRTAVLDQWRSFQQYGHDFLGEFRVNTEAGETRHARVRAVRLLQRLPGGELAPAYLGVTEDVTEQRRLQDELVKARHILEQRVGERTAQLEAANAELMRFASVAAHDLKAPLRGVNNLAEWLIADHGEALSEEGRETCRLLQQRVTQMHRLIEGILEYTRLGTDAGIEARVSLGALLPHLVEVLSPPSHITIDLPAKLPEIQAVPEQLRQVFQNLIQNAIKFMDKPAGRIVVAVSRQTDGWLFTVEDNGPGIHQRYHRKIFEVFERLHRGGSTDSTGIGLAIVKRIVEGRGGRVWVESTEGQGTTFFFTWPDIQASRLAAVKV